MTRSIAREVERRGRGRPPLDTTLGFASDLSARIRLDQTFIDRVRFPSAHYRNDPAAFMREVLGVEPWDRQVEVLEAVRDHPRTAISSGHKVGKSISAGVLAHWFYCSFEDARAVMSSTTSRQVDQILWREVRMLRARGGRCVKCKAEDPEQLRIPKPCPHSTLIEGEIGDLARTGLNAPDFRQIVGFTAREAEAVAGISGRNLLYIVDEASGVPDEIFEAIEGNMAGGARLAMFSNPTRNSGYFYNAFTSKRRFWHTLRISSEETPNVKAGRVVIPGLATREWIEEKREEWGEDSPLFKIRVKGEHVTYEEGRIFSVHVIEQAETRWHNAPEAGRLYVGIDPAGESGLGDESLFAPRRGLKLLTLRGVRGLDIDGHVTYAVRLLAELRLPRETPVIVLDSEGPIGAKLRRALDVYLDEYPNAFELVSVRASDKAQREPRNYDRTRDELAANLKSWFDDGGAIVEDTRLATELHIMEWLLLANGKRKLTPKEAIRKELGRSPDRYDALALSVWEPLSLQAAETAKQQQKKARRSDERMAETSLDPYASSDVWQRS